MVKFIFTILIQFAIFNSAPISANIHSQKIRVNLDQITLRESIEWLSQIFDMKIVLVSNTGKISHGRFSLNLEEATLEHSLKEVMRGAKVQNHALFLDQNNKTVLVWILSTEERQAIGRKVRNNLLYKYDPEPLTMDQLLLLAQHSPGPAELDDKPLTMKQMEHLQEQSVRMEAETEEFLEPLTPEQTEQLKEQSLWVEEGMEEDQEPLSEEQMDQLHNQHVEIELENESDQQPLDKEQLFLLKEQEYKMENEK